MNLCINCKHHAVVTVMSQHACLMTKTTVIDPVTGAEEESMKSCHAERLPDGRCGPDGTRFEPRTEPTVDDLCKK